MWDFFGQILDADVWTKLQIFQPGMCRVPGRLLTTERVERERPAEGGKGKRGVRTCRRYWLRSKGAESYEIRRCVRGEGFV